MPRVRPRDNHGWRVPHPDTKARDVYDLLVGGLTEHEIADRLGRRRGMIGVEIWRIRHPETHNHRAGNERRRALGLPLLRPRASA